MTILTKKQRLALLSYRLVFILLAPIIVLLLLWRSTSNKAYRARLSERLGLVNNTFKKHGIIIHAASVGEVFALKVLVEKLLVTYPNTPITFTTFTPTGSEQVTKLFGDRVQHCYLPLDFIFSTSWFLKALQPKLMIFMETELWPNLVHQAKQKHIQLLLINGRLSTSSMKSYVKLTPLMAPCLQQFDHILSQSDDNQQNFLTLGAHTKQCLVSGNLKYDMSMSDSINDTMSTLKKMLPSNKKIWVMASTHQGDEDIALESFQTLSQQFSDLLLIIVPRHPERFSHVYDLAQQAGFTTEKRSSHQIISSDCQVWILDTLGELMALYGLADFITIGGSFSDIGGHNPLEPAWFKKPIVVGHNMRNFTDVMQQMLDHNGITQLTDAKPASIQLTNVITNWLTQKEQQNTAEILGNNAYQVVQKNQGAVDITLGKITSLMDTHIH